MKVCIAGSRSITDGKVVYRELDNINKPVEIVCISSVVTGGARGVDQLAEVWAYAKGFKVKTVRPDYEKHGKRAPLIRNVQMAEECDALIALWDGYSKGTKFTIDEFAKRGKPSYMILVGKGKR